MTAATPQARAGRIMKLKAKDEVGMSKSAKVKQIVIQIGETELSLKPDEARELMNALKELLEPEEKTTYVPYPVYPEYRRWVWTGPYWSITAPNTAGQYTITATSTTIE